MIQFNGRRRTPDPTQVMHTSDRCQPDASRAGTLMEERLRTRVDALEHHCAAIGGVARVVGSPFLFREGWAREGNRAVPFPVVAKLEAMHEIHCRVGYWRDQVRSGAG
jgi:hypothetical protein